MVQRVWDGLSSVAGWDMNFLFPGEHCNGVCWRMPDGTSIEGKLLVETWSWSVIEGAFGIGL